MAESTTCETTFNTNLFFFVLLCILTKNVHRKEVVISIKKDKYYPIISFNSNETFTDIPIPSNQEWSVVTQKVFPSRCLTSFIYPKTTIPWEEKQKTAVFRGTATGCSYTIEGNPRLLVSKLDKEWSAKPPEDGIPYLDAGITHFPNKHTPTWWTQMNTRMRAKLR